MRRNKAGFATLEAALYISLLLFLITGSFATIEWVRLQSNLGTSLEKGLYNTSLVPYQVRTNSLGIDLAVNEQVLETHLQQAMLTVQTSMQESLGSRILNISDYRIEARYYEIAINQELGVATGLRSQGAELSIGSLQVPTSVLSGTHLDDLVQNFIQEMTDQQGRFLYSTPSTKFGSQSNVQFMNGSVVLAIRAFMQIPSGVTKNVMNLLSIEPVISSTNISALRGEVAL